MKKIMFFSIITMITIPVVFVRPHYISGDCMEPAIKDGHLYFVDWISPYLRQYQKGDIITFEHEGKMWISRIVALGTDIVQIVVRKYNNQWAIAA